jgi:RHS repeat-associated protein
MTLYKSKRMKLTPLLSLCLTVCLFACVVASSSHAASNPYISRHGVNFSTGNKYLYQSDVSLSGPVSTLSFSRNYNSQNAEISILGAGWTFSWNDRLLFGSNQSLVIYKQSDGSVIRLAASGTDTWVSQLGKKIVLSRTTDGYTLTKLDNTQFSFNTDGHLVERRSRNDNIVTLSYDGDTLTTIVDNFGRSITLQYNEDSLLTTLSSPIGTYTYGYDTNKNLTSVTKPDGSSDHYLYTDPNGIHNLTGIVNEENVRTQTIGYDSLDRVVSSALTDGSEAITIDYQAVNKRVITSNQGVATTYQLTLIQGIPKVGSMSGPGCSSCGGTADTNYLYDSKSQITQSTDANGIKTTYTYDEYGNTISVTRAFGTTLASTTTTTYDPTTNQVATITRQSVANPGQQTVTAMSYDAEGNLLNRQQDGFSGTSAITSTTQYIYNSYGQVTSIDGPRTDVNDSVNVTYYPNEAGQSHNRGNLQTVTNALDHGVTYSDYNVFGQAETVTDQNGIVTTRTFDINGHLTTATTSGLTTSYTYTSSGRLETITQPGNRVVSYSYTAAGQIAEISDNLGNTISYSYDSEGRRIGEEIQDPENTLTRFAGYGYDDYGRMNRMTLPGDAEENSEYDLVGNLVTTINTASMQTDYLYDSLNRLLSVTEAGTTAVSYVYDAHDNISQVTDAKGKVTSFSYDDFGRMLIRTAPDTGLITYVYDQAGNLLTATDAKGQSTSFTYDAINRPVSQSYAGTGGDILFAYDQGNKAIGHLSQISDREGTDSFAYDNTGRIVGETRVIGTQSHTIGYSWDNTTGDLAGMTYPSGLSLTYGRDANGQISAISLDGTALVSAVTHLPFGPLKAAALGSANLTRNYDQRYNVANIKGGGLDYVYTRDAGGHVTSIANYLAPSVTDEQTHYNYNSANNQLDGSTGTAPKTYTYDANGNMVSDGTNTLSYDGLNRIIQIDNQSGTVATYGYDSSNRRIRKTVGSTTIHYLYDLNSQLIAETLLDGTPLREYIYLDGEPLALREYQTSPGIYYYINDHLGTPQRLVDGSGDVVWQAAYLPFGKAEVLTSTVVNNLRFPGQYYDAETGLHYNWHRFYDPSTGRYISADPIGLAGGINLYAYVAGNPVNWIDPWGLRTCGYEYSGNPYEVANGDTRTDSQIIPFADFTSKVPSIPRKPTDLIGWRKKYYIEYGWYEDGYDIKAPRQWVCYDECGKEVYRGWAESEVIDTKWKYRNNSEFFIRFLKPEHYIQIPDYTPW